MKGLDGKEGSKDAKVAGKEKRNRKEIREEKRRGSRQGGKEARRQGGIGIRNRVV